MNEEEPMRRLHRAVPCGLALLLAAQACRPGGGGGPAPVPLAPPPTFVLAWNGPGGGITTAESSDGLVWTRRIVHGTTNSALFGPALAHDGALTWLLMWADGPELRFKAGVGGTTAASGITWESVPTSGVLSVQPASSPAIAFANGRWLAVWHDASGQLMGVRSTGAPWAHAARPTSTSPSSCDMRATAESCRPSARARSSPRSSGRAAVTPSGARRDGCSRARSRRRPPSRSRSSRRRTTAA